MHRNLHRGNDLLNAQDGPRELLIALYIMIKKIRHLSSQHYLDYDEVSPRGGIYQITDDKVACLSILDLSISCPRPCNNKLCVASRNVSSVSE